MRPIRGTDPVTYQFPSVDHLHDLPSVSISHSPSFSQCARHFLILDNSAGIQLYTYEGRQLCNPKFQGLRTELLNRVMVRRERRGRMEVVRDDAMSG